MLPMQPRSIVPGIVGILASLLGGTFSALSTSDYAAHLDRQLHGAHCSFIPGVGSATADNACTKAMYSPYSAVLKETLWGGIPISLFGLGAFVFFLALSVYLVAARDAASQRFRLGFLLCTLGPVAASVTMAIVSITQLGELCKLCVGVYVSSFLLFIAGILSFLGGRKTFGAVATGVATGAGRVAPTKIDPDATQADPEPWHKNGDGGSAKARPATSAAALLDGLEGKVRSVEAPKGSVLAVLALPAALGLSTVLPGVVYAASLPNYDDTIASCGALATATAKGNALVSIPTKNPKEPALFFEDPLCPTCKAFHERLVSQGVYDQLEVTVAIFPLDSECNWMLSRPMHPGACVLARAFLCGDKAGNAREILEWSYENQEELTRLGKDDPAKVKAKLLGRFKGVEGCIDAKETKKRLDDVLHFAVANKLRISTPQLFLGEKRMCDEDTDLGLDYALTKLAPKVKP
jgi:uncharacterized membrane protein/protein-disulfide isomerase